MGWQLGLFIVNVKSYTKQYGRYDLNVDKCMSYVIEYDKECKLTRTVNVPADVNYFIIRQTPDFK